MAIRTAAPENIDEYIAASAAEVQPILKKIRMAISAAAPEAREVISYRMPASRVRGMLVYFALQSSHRSLSAGVGGCQFEEGALPLRRAKRQSQVPARSTQSLHSYQARRAPQSETGPLATRGGKEETIEPS